jgi:hypothetical protein
MKKLLYILLLSPLFFISSCEEEGPIHGCLDSQASNYNPEASLDNNSCKYIELGVFAEGGIVFYIDETGEHGKVADIQDLGQMNWYDAISFAASATSQGYGDWFLPSKDELIEMYNTIGNGSPEGNVGGFETDVFENDLYWSSSEYSNNNAWNVHFGNGNPTNYNKNGTGRVRVIRAF